MVFEVKTKDDTTLQLTLVRESDDTISLRDDKNDSFGSLIEENNSFVISAIDYQ